MSRFVSLVLALASAALIVVVAIFATRLWAPALELPAWPLAAWAAYFFGQFVYERSRGGEVGWFACASVGACVFGALGFAGGRVPSLLVAFYAMPLGVAVGCVAGFAYWLIKKPVVRESHVERP